MSVLTLHYRLLNHGAGDWPSIAIEATSRIAELEAALHRVWSLSMAVQAEIDNDGPEASVAEINGRMVEIATECSRLVEKQEND